MLELERMKQLDVKALTIQRVLRGYKYRYDTNSVAFLFINATPWIFIFTLSKGENSWGKEQVLLSFRNIGEDTKAESCSKWRVLLKEPVLGKAARLTCINALPSIFRHRSSMVLQGCRHRFLPVRCSSGIEESGRQPSCCRPSSGDTWLERNGNAKETLWSSCRLTREACWQEKPWIRQKDM